MSGFCRAPSKILSEKRVFSRLERITRPAGSQQAGAFHGGFASREAAFRNVERHDGAPSAPANI